MDQIKIKGNNHWIEIISFWELTEKEQNEIRDNYEDIQNSSFFWYKGRVYDLSDFMRLTNGNPFSGEYHGYHADSFFSGILIRLSDCGDCLQAYTYMS